VRGVDAGTTAAGHDLEDAEVLDADRPPAEQRALHRAEERVDDLRRLLLGQRAVAVVDLVDEERLGPPAVTRERFPRRYRAALRHVPIPADSRIEDSRRKYHIREIT